MPRLYILYVVVLYMCGIVDAAGRRDSTQTSSYYDTITHRPTLGHLSLAQSYFSGQTIGSNALTQLYD